MLRTHALHIRDRLTLAGLLVALGLAAPSSALAATAPPAAVRGAASAARAYFHTRDVRADFSLLSRRDARWALVDGTATGRNRLWAAWLYNGGTGKWELRYFDTTAPFQPRSTAHGRVPCDLYPAFSEARCPPGGPTAPQMKAQLFKQLLPSGTAAKIASLLKNHGYSFSFKPPVSGSLVIAWYLVPRRTPVNAVPPTARLIARGNGDFFSGRRGRMTLRLTSAGRKVLKGAVSVRLTAKGTFTPILYRAVFAARTFTLSR